MFRRAAAGAQAFMAGRTLAQQLTRRQAGIVEVRELVRRENPVTLAATGAGLAFTTWTMLKKRELLALAALGALVGSGVLERGLRRLVE